MAGSTDKINHDEIRQSAGKEGEAAFKVGLNIDEVVHVYGDVCQTITELAVELDVRVPTGEFRVMNPCLDDAIAQAATQFASHNVGSSEIQRIDLSPPGTEGPNISGTAGTQGPTRWRVNGSSPFPAARRSVQGQKMRGGRHFSWASRLF